MKKILTTETYDLQNRIGLLRNTKTRYPGRTSCCWTMIGNESNNSGNSNPFSKWMLVFLLDLLASPLNRWNKLVWARNFWKKHTTTANRPR
jgi:hypothetical protein